MKRLYNFSHAKIEQINIVARHVLLQTQISSDFKLVVGKNDSVPLMSPEGN